jgi:hypothetical protein
MRSAPARPFAIALLIASLLAGCLGPAAPATSPAAHPTPGALPRSGVQANPGSGSNAAVPGSTNLGSIPHRHDYWNGRTRVTLFDDVLQPDTENATFATLVQIAFLHRIAAGGMEWYLPAGKTVYEGTGFVELTATWTDPRTTSMAFAYQSAQGPNFAYGGALANGKPFDLPVTDAMTDMAHSTMSRWRFYFGPDQTPGAALGPFHLKVDIIRTRDVALMPPHPDFWQGKHAITLLDVDHHGQQVSYVERVPQLVRSGNLSEDEVALAHPVPMETQEVRFDITVSSASSTPGKVTALGFFYHGADRPDMLRCSVKALNASLPATLSWVVPNPMDSSDSPYANDSQWRFLAEPQVSYTGIDPPSGGMTSVQIVYHVVATAFDSTVVKPETCRVNQ